MILRGMESKRLGRDDAGVVYDFRADNLAG